MFKIYGFKRGGFKYYFLVKEVVGYGICIYEVFEE